jgi:hypothetical protein
MSDNPLIKDDLLVLKASAHVEAVGSTNCTGIAAGPTGLVKAVILVTLVDSGGTLDAHLEESADDSSYTNIANATFTQITAAGVAELCFRAAQKYVRLVYTVGTAAVTFEAFLTTIEK